MLRRSRYEKRTKQIFCTRSENWSENRSSRFEPRILLISFSRGSGPFLRSDTETHFPRPVRSAKRSRFAATVFVRSKPVNWVRILPQMFRFLMDTTKTEEIKQWIVHNYWFLHVSIYVCSWSSLTRYIENTAARSWSWSKWGDRGGVVIWWKIFWQVFLRGHIWDIFVWKPHPFREIPGQRKGRGQAGRRYYEHASTIILPQIIYIASVLFTVT